MPFGARAPGMLARVVPIVAVLLVASAGVIAATFFAGQAVRTLATASLESTARAVSLAAERVLGEEGGRGVEFERLFADRVVAYALLADHGGRVVFHTNPDLRGTAMRDDAGADGSEGAVGEGRRVVLGTGRPVWILDRRLRRGDGSPNLLRVALHTVEADRMLARVQRLWWSVGAVLTLLWGGGALILGLSLRSARLERDLERREALALVGQMTATLAHEIRNAIGSVKGYAQLAAEQTEASDPRARSLATVLRGVERIERLVGDLLGYAREENYRLEATDAGALLHAAAEGAAGWAGEVEFDLEPGLAVLGDGEKLAQVLANGVRNALQAMGESGRLRLATRTRAGRVSIQIEDSGEGITREALPRLFTPFYTTRAVGTGLGLARAKKLVEGMGGEITLENVAGGRGAVFTLLLPRVERRGPPAAREEICDR